MPLLKDLITIPERVHQGDYVLQLTKGVTEPEQTLRDVFARGQTPAVVAFLSGLVQVPVDHVVEVDRQGVVLLKRLLAHPERVFTRAELMESVWAGAEDSSDRTVDAHIKTLRAKLRLVDPQAEPIQTHRGLGYSLGRFE